MTIRRTDITIIGAGIVGLSLAWHLQRLGVDRVVVLERGSAGGQSTGLAAGGIRRQFATRIEIEMTLAGWQFYEAVLSDPGFPGKFEPAGYVFLAGPQQAESLQRAWALQRELALPVQWLERSDLADLCPYCDLSGLSCGTLCADDGFIRPSEVVQWLLRECRSRGILIREHTPVDALEISAGRIRAVRSGSARTSSDVVVNAAGAWAGVVGTMAGVNIPVEPSPRIKLIAEGNTGLPGETPMIVDLPSGTYLRSNRARTTVGVKPEKRVVSFGVEADVGLLLSMLRRASARFPGLRHAQVRGVIKGLYELTPDGLPLAGPVAGVAGLYVAAGFNGHGIMHGPGVTRALAQLIVTGSAEALDLERLHPDRFERRAAEERVSFL